MPPVNMKFISRTMREAKKASKENKALETKSLWLQIWHWSPDSNKLSLIDEKK